MAPRVDKWLDLIDRVGWTGVQAAVGALAAYLVTDDIGWEEGLIFVGTAVVVSIAKVLIGQNTGTDDTGSLIGQSVIEPAPKEKR
jgi:hypothetical protein